jgi:hypothetical protein
MNTNYVLRAKIQNLTPRPIAKQTLSTKNAQVQFVGLSLSVKMWEDVKRTELPCAGAQNLKMIRKLGSGASQQNWQILLLVGNGVKAYQASLFL